MKIAIPTHDGLSLCPDFGRAKGILVLTVLRGKVTREELRWNTLSLMLLSSDGLLANCTDCDVVMAQHISPGLANMLKQQNKEIFTSDEEIITNAYVKYLEECCRRKAHTCCCP